MLSVGRNQDKGGVIQGGLCLRAGDCKRAALRGPVEVQWRELAFTYSPSLLPPSVP